MGKEHNPKRKEKTEGSGKTFVPGEETEEQFYAVLARLSEWIKAGVVNLEIDPDADVRLELPSEMASLLGTEVPAGLTSDDVRGIVQKEIPALLSARLKSEPRDWLKSILPEQVGDKVDMMLERSKRAFSSLIDKNLKERLFLRKTTPGYVVPSIRRVVTTTYHAESAEGERVDVPVVCLEFEFTKPGSGYALEVSMRGPSVVTRRKDDVRVTVDVHKDDISGLIKALEKIRQGMTAEKRD